MTCGGIAFEKYYRIYIIFTNFGNDTKTFSSFSKYLGIIFQGKDAAFYNNFYHDTSLKFYKNIKYNCRFYFTNTIP